MFRYSKVSLLNIFNALLKNTVEVEEWKKKKTINREFVNKEKFMLQAKQVGPHAKRNIVTRNEKKVLVKKNNTNNMIFFIFM